MQSNRLCDGSSLQAPNLSILLRDLDGIDGSPGSSNKFSRETKLRNIAKR